MRPLENKLNELINDKAKDIDAFKKKPSRVKGIDADKVDSLAQRLVEKFNSERSWGFYCLVAWHVPEREIWLMVETAQAKAKYSAGGYFHALAARALRKQGIFLKSKSGEDVAVEVQSELVPEEESELEVETEPSEEIINLDDIELPDSDEPIRLEDIPF
jgi:hypothetical protein